MIKQMYWGMLQHNEQTFYLAASNSGVCRVMLSTEPFQFMIDWLQRRNLRGNLVHDEERVSPYLKQLKEYMEGRRTNFTAPVDLHGTEFQIMVWHQLQSIPVGETRSYSDIANAIGRSKSVRAVGAAIGANPVPIVVPCHRVIGKNGALAGYQGGLDLKRELLELERATFHSHP